jgi:hypothetical protein
MAKESFARWRGATDTVMSNIYGITQITQVWVTNG